MSRITLGLAAFCVSLFLAAAAFAEEPPAADMAAVKACTDLVAKNSKNRPPHNLDELEEKTGPQGRLAAAAKAVSFAPSSCIGVLAVACIQKEGEAPRDNVFRDCYGREARVWDKRLNVAYRAASAKMDKEAADNLRKTQRDWIAWRDASCKQPWAVFQGSMAGPMEAYCTLSLIANQAIWMEGWVESTTIANQ